MELLATQDQKTLDMKKKVKDVESSIWYSETGGKNRGMWLPSREKNNAPSVIHEPGTNGANVPIAVNITTKRIL